MSAVVKRSKGESPGKPYVRPATREDCLDLAPRLRPEDVQEMYHSNGLPPHLGLLLSYSLGTTYAVVWGEEVVALFGHVGIPGSIGVPWMMASPTLERIKKSFLRECRRYVREMLEIYDHLENRVWAHNEAHIKWVRWLGFQFDEAQSFGINKEPFYRFYMTRQNV